MKRDEKNEIMRRKILEGAVAEFSENGYGAGSMNHICSSNDISKGIIYHYFESKDELYLACVKECFQSLTAYLEENLVKKKMDAEKCLNQYFLLRSDFFRKYPYYQHIFCEALVSPPAHLRDAIRAGKREFDELNVSILKELLSGFSLRGDLSIGSVVEVFRQLQDFINIRYQLTAEEARPFASREEDCRRLIDILLYGVVKQENTND